MVNNWDHIVQEGESIALSGDDLLKIVKGKANLHKYSDLDNINSIQQLLGDNKATFILYQHESGWGHWTCMMQIDENTLEFYDSLGIRMDDELKFSDFNLSLHKGERVPHLTRLVENSGMKLIQSSQKSQKSVRGVNTCGRFVSLRIKLRNLPLDEFNKLLRKNTSGNADFVVSYLTLLLTM